MKVILINSEYPPVGGGAGNASQYIAQQLAKMGHQVAVVTSRYGDLHQQEEFDNLTLYRIPAFRRRPDRSNAFEQAIFIVSASLWTSSLIRRFKPDATLAFFGVPSGAVSLFIKLTLKIPYIVSLRGGDVPGFRSYDFGRYHRLIAPLLRAIWRHASVIVANSNGLRDLALTFDARFEIPVIPNGVELDLYKTEERDWAVPRMLSVGRIVYQKGLDIAMRALAGLQDHEWEWHLAGDGPQLEALKSLAKELGIAERVTFHGWQSRAQLIEQYQRSNLFLFPSRHEGMPNAVLEAMASGLPVIASRIAGNEELVLHDKTGLLVETEKVDVLRHALHKLLGNASLRQEMGRAARLRVEEYYSWENTAKQYALLLEQVQ